MYLLYSAVLLIDIQLLSSVLQCHLYFINLAYIDSDSELFQAFANVPANSIVVFEDIDTMTPVCRGQTTP